MRGGSRSFAIFVGAAIAVMGSTGVEAKPKDTAVEYVGGSTCVEVAASVEIYSDHWRNWGKPKRVEWTTVDDQKHQYYWEIVYKGNGDDLIGSVDPIDCSSRTTGSKTTRDVGEGAQAEWVYKIVVSQCDEEGNQDEVLCETDPIIIINGGP